MANHIITIGRECGSGGHSIGKLLAEHLGLKFYDKEIVELAAKMTKLSPEFIRANGEYFQGGSLSHIMGYGARFDIAAPCGSSLADQLHRVQTEIILEAAEEGPCVIVGRCADYILRDRYPTLNVFIHSAMSYKIERSVREHDMDRDEAPSILIKRDKARAQNYRFYTDLKWGDVRNYDLCLDSGSLGVNTCVELISNAYKRLCDKV